MGNDMLVQDAAGRGIRQNILQSVADLHAHFSVLDRDQKEQAVVLAFLADSPLFKKAICKIIDFTSGERLQGDDGDLRAGFLAQLSEQPFELLLLDDGEQLGPICDVAGWLELREKCVKFRRGTRRADGRHEKHKAGAGQEGEPRQSTRMAGGRFGWSVRTL